MSEKHFVYGYHATRAVLMTQPGLVNQLYCARQEKNLRQQELLKLAEELALPVKQISNQQMKSLIAKNANHQGLLADCTALPEYSEADLLALLNKLNEPVLLLALDGVQDPHNLGACLRAALAFGAHGVLIPKNRAVGITSAVRKVACGAAELVPVVQVTNLSRSLRKLQDKGAWVVGMASENELPLAEIDLSGDIVIVMGGEGDGMRRLTKEHCDYLARIDINQHMESLNVSVAAGIALYEVSRQRNTAELVK
ncbi:MAG: 23S rRNA (guanosine(2251)-2'-O)-methyltransferase RlmB [Gammaproteobacteria bacterium]|nr:23S rRNA (guanosine(2251)-2'-O)-methyltransferase RlmB [Gammaproteobacteria bacterium]